MVHSEGLNKVRKAEHFRLFLSKYKFKIQSVYEIRYPDKRGHTGGDKLEIDTEISKNKIAL